MFNIKRISVLILPFLLSACMAHHDKIRATELNNYSESTIKEKLIIDSATKKDVLILLGAPNSPKDYNNSNEWLYKSFLIHRRMYLFIPVNKDKKQFLTLNFDGMGVLSSLKYRDKASNGVFIWP